MKMAWGEEIEYRHDGSIECDGCGNEISFRISVMNILLEPLTMRTLRSQAALAKSHMGVIYSRMILTQNDALSRVFKSRIVDYGNRSRPDLIPQHFSKRI